MEDMTKRYHDKGIL